jgi:hypothetical protein
VGKQACYPILEIKNNIWPDWNIDKMILNALWKNQEFLAM